MTYTPEQRKAALAMLIANEWSCVDLACHVTVLREALMKALDYHDCGTDACGNFNEKCSVCIPFHEVLAQTAPKESHHAD